MPWPEDDPMFKAELNNKVVYGGDESSPSGNLLFLLVMIDFIQAGCLTDFCVTIEIMEFIKKLISYIS